MKDLLNKNLYKADNFVELAMKLNPHPSLNKKTGAVSFIEQNSYIIPLKAATILANVDPREAGILYFIEILQNFEDEESLTVKRYDELSDRTEGNVNFSQQVNMSIV